MMKTSNPVSIGPSSRAWRPLWHAVRPTARAHAARKSAAMRNREAREGKPNRGRRSIRPRDRAGSPLQALEIGDQRRLVGVGEIRAELVAGGAVAELGGVEQKAFVHPRHRAAGGLLQQISE